MPKSPLKYHGGKSYLARKIIDLLPKRDETFTHFHESCFGGGAVTFALDPEGLSETVNDLDGELINFWRVLAHSDLFMGFYNTICMTPFSDSVFDSSLLSVRDNEYHKYMKACCFFIRNRQSRQGLGKDYATPTRRTRKGMNENVSAWLSAINGLPEVHERLQRIEIRNMNVFEFIKKYDHKKAVFYIDPPYLHSTRSTGGGEYQFEMTFEDHGRLLAVLGSVEGRFLLSGYPSDVYDEASDAFGWNRTDIQIDNKASSKKTKEIKTECVWRNFT